MNIEFQNVKKCYKNSPLELIKNNYAQNMFNLNYQIIFSTHIPDSLKNIFSDNIIYYIILLCFEYKESRNGTEF